MTLTRRRRNRRNLARDRRRRLAEYTLRVVCLETTATQTIRLVCCPKFACMKNVCCNALLTMRVSHTAAPRCRRNLLPVANGNAPPYVPNDTFPFIFRRLPFTLTDFYEELRLRWEQPPSPPPTTTSSWMGNLSAKSPQLLFVTVCGLLI